ncbi:MAG: hypothetical protein RLY14_83 [Planctomycetota bacterium]|jgi:5'-nucleotidase
MNILITNDDGIAAEGLAALAATISRYAEVTVVAPKDHQSCCGHGVTTTRPLAFGKSREGWFWVDGLPADCVRVAILHLGLKPDWVLSGINHGGNLGVDIWMSGTVAAAREASILGLRSMAISQYRRQDVEVPWELSAHRAARAWHYLSSLALRPQELWNINLPAVEAHIDESEWLFSHTIQPESKQNNLATVSDIPLPTNPALVDCNPESQPLSFHLEQSEQGLIYRSNYHQRPRLPNSDVANCFAGNITFSRLSTSHVFTNGRMQA